MQCMSLKCAQAWLRRWNYIPHFWNSNQKSVTKPTFVSKQTFHIACNMQACIHIYFCFFFNLKYKEYTRFPKFKLIDKIMSPNQNVFDWRFKRNGCRWVTATAKRKVNAFWIRIELLLWFNRSHWSKVGSKTE